MTDGNVLYYGDNLDVLRRHVRDESVELVYLDPPFKSDADYNVLFEEHGEKSAAQVRAFEDTWEWNTDARAAYEEIVELGGPVADTMRAFRTMLGGSDMLAYLSMIAPRLIELRRVLKPTGSIYLHCDQTASAHLRLLMDAVFGPRNFLNEIIWSYRRWPSITKRYQRMHDTLLFYAKNRGQQTFHVEYEANSPSYVKRFKGKTQVLDPETRTRKLVSEQDSLGLPRRDVWELSIIAGVSKERLGYPTQKPLALLERVVAVSSNPGDVVLDPFCGCGTTIDAAQGLGRRWIGIDITHLSIGLIKHRLVDRYGPEISHTYRVVGEPTTTEDAAVLARDDPFQFQAWALGLVGARIATSDKRGGDKGVDGRLYFHDSASGPTRQIVFSVKAGGLVPGYVRDLRGVVEREKADLGVLLSFEEPSPGMRSEAADAGFYESPWGRHPRLQLRTIRELLDGKGVDYPHVTGANVTLRRARRARAAGPEAMELFGRAAEEPEAYGSN